MISKDIRALDAAIIANIGRVNSKGEGDLKSHLGTNSGISTEMVGTEGRGGEVFNPSMGGVWIFLETTYSKVVETKIHRLPYWDTLH